jgi:hypothetical protein
MFDLDVSSNIGTLPSSMEVMMKPQIELIEPKVFTEPTKLVESGHAEQGCRIEGVKFFLVEPCEPARNRSMAQSMYIVRREKGIAVFELRNDRCYRRIILTEQDEGAHLREKVTWQRGVLIQCK